MGGYGSGRWRQRGATRKRTVEEGFSLSIRRFDRQALATGRATVGTLRLRSAYGRQTTVLYIMGQPEKTGDQRVLLLHPIRWPDTEQEEDWTGIWLTTTPCTFGGVRWWFTCPLVRDGQPCGRRAGTLYLPVASRYFGCRTCHDLTYRRRQEAPLSSRQIALVRSVCPDIDPALLDAMWTGRWTTDVRNTE